jgi:hypothetical protein
VNYGERSIVSTLSGFEHFCQRLRDFTNICTDTAIKAQALKHGLAIPKAVKKISYSRQNLEKVGLKISIQAGCHCDNGDFGSTSK